MQTRPTILVMDDDIDLLEVIQETLISLCQVEQVLIAKSLAEVQAQKEQILNCQLAILDVNLGAEKPSGINVAEWLREKGFKGKVIFLTGHAISDPEILSATRMPDTRVVAKPIGLSQLLGFVESIYAKWQNAQRET